MQGVIVKGIGGFYYTRTEDGEIFTLRPKGTFRKQNITPVAGDIVRFDPNTGEEESWIEEILPRRNLLTRPPVANVSYLLIVVAPKPQPDLLLADALLIQAHRQQIAPAIILNKSDLNTQLCQDIRMQYAGAGIPVLITSVKSGEGLNELAALMRQGICCFAGQSGVGKSSLVAAVTGIDLHVGEISKKNSRGKHTTRHAELLIQNEFQVLDTAGFSLLGQINTEDPVVLKDYYPEFTDYEAQCKFQPCYHRSEPSCAVLAARDNGLIAKERVMRYHQLLENAKEAWEGRYE